MTGRRLWLTCVAIAVLSGCGGSGTGGPGGTGATVPTATSTRPPVSLAATDPAEVNMCTLVGLGDVQSQSPFKEPLTRVEPMTSPGGCRYAARIGAENPDSIGLVVTHWYSVEQAAGSMKQGRQDATDRGIPPQDIGGLGDEAYAVPGGDEVSVKATSRTYEVLAAFKGEWPDVDNGPKIAAGTALVRLIISRLP